MSRAVFDDDFGDERNPAGDPLPPEDRLWRHPSEVGASRRARLAGHGHTPPARPMLAVLLETEVTVRPDAVASPRAATADSLVRTDRPVAASASSP